jgi:hypothetical protein
MGAPGRSLTKLIASCYENFDNPTAIPTECGFNPVWLDLPSTMVAVLLSKKRRAVCETVPGGHGLERASARYFAAPATTSRAAIGCSAGLAGGQPASSLSRACENPSLVNRTG